MLWLGLLVLIHYAVYVVACRYGLRGWHNVERLGRTARGLWWVFGLAVPITFAGMFLSPDWEWLMVGPSLAVCGLLAAAWPIHRAYRRFTRPEPDEESDSTKYY